MKRHLIFSFILLSSLIFYNTANAGRSGKFLGPLLGNSATTLPKNTLLLTPYYLYTVVKSPFIKNDNFITNGKSYFSDIYALQATLGVTDNFTGCVFAPFYHSIKNFQNYDGIGDVRLNFGYQIIKQDRQKSMPNIRLTIQETVPTGKYSHLSPILNGSDATGLGSYQTYFSTNLSYLSTPILGHDFLATLNIGYLFAVPAYVYSTNSFGGNVRTEGDIHPGNMVSADIVFEFEYTNKIFFLVESFLAYRGKATFASHFPITEDEARKIGSLSFKEITILPGIEYNFSRAVGVVAGFWTTLGNNYKEGPIFYAPILMLSVSV